jgi:leucyl/phenylalanyl-tRNA---protein transferase
MDRQGNEQQRLTPELVLRAYAAGIFPMAEYRDDPTIFWVDPKVRGILPLETVHVPRKLRRTVRRGLFEVRFNTAFAQVMTTCAEATSERRETWINEEIHNAYVELHRRGFAHSVECWVHDQLVGGLYGVSLGAAFFGESMFSRETDASKVALVHLVARLISGGYRLLDCQFVTEHLRQFGVIEIPARDYLERLEEAISHQGVFLAEGDQAQFSAVMERVLSGEG